MASTYEPIATTTLGSTAASITFSSIAATYTDLRVICVPINSGASDYSLVMQVNGDTASNYSQTDLYGTGASALSSQQSAVTYINLTDLAGYSAKPSLFTADIFSYAGSTYKTILTTCSIDQNATLSNGTVARQVGLWRSTSAITSVTIKNLGATVFAVGTTATLYGIKAA
jgi:hypothetical protein